MIRHIYPIRHEANVSRNGRYMTFQPLTDIELDGLADILTQFGGPDSMNLEGLDGFFSALICGPALVLPSEYLPAIWGTKAARNPSLTQPILEEFISLVTRHWNTIADTLESGDVFTPLLIEGEQHVMIGPPVLCGGWSYGGRIGLPSWRTRRTLVQ
jgi:yecA family protein